MPDENQNPQPNNQEGAAPESQPNPAPTDSFPQPIADQQPAATFQTQKPSHKKYIIGGIIAAILVALLGGGALAYTMYQSPEKVLSDSIINLAQASGSMSGTGSVKFSNDQVDMTIEASAKGDGSTVNGNAKLSISFKSESLKAIGDLTATTDYAANDDGVWIKLNDISNVVNKALDTYVDSMKSQYAEMGFSITDEELAEQKSMMQKQIQPILDKINNRWIKLDSDSSENEDSESQCMLDAFKKATSDKSQRSELTDVYNNNQFIIIKEKLGAKDGNLGYKLDFDSTKAASFANAIKDTQLGKALLECDPNAFDDELNTEEAEEVKQQSDVEVWVGQWDHKLRRAAVTATPDQDDDNPTSAKLEVTLNYDKVTGLSTPKDATTIEDIQSEIQDLMMGGAAVVPEV